MRLAADPFPILLMDEEILYRCFDSMTDPYTEDFVDEYIGVKTVEEYKHTELYTSFYSFFIDKEKKNEATFSIMQYNYIDTTKKEEILSQLCLLPKETVVCTTIALSCNKVVKAYAADGIMMFFTDRKTNREAMSWSSKDFHVYANHESKYNQQFDEAYISVFQFEGEYYYAEHNVILNNDEIDVIKQSLLKLSMTDDWYTPEVKAKEKISDYWITTDGAVPVVADPSVCRRPANRQGDHVAVEAVVDVAPAKPALEEHPEDLGAVGEVDVRDFTLTAAHGVRENGVALIQELGDLFGVDSADVVLKHGVFLSGHFALSNSGACGSG